MGSIGETRVLVATFGFDIDFVLRRISGRRYERVVLLSLRTPEGEKRVDKAFATLNAYCLSINIECRLEKLGESGLIRSVFSILVEEARKGMVELFLTGGPRILVVSALLAAFMLGSEATRRINVVVEGEAFERELEAPLSTLKKLASLDEKSREVVMYTATLRKAGLGELSRVLGLPKPTVFRRIQKLLGEGILCREGDEYVLCPEIDRFL
jgi:CRISPR-associated protein Csa3